MEDGFISILGVVVGGLIGFGTSYVTLRLQWRKERRAIALGFKKEIECQTSWFEVKLEVFDGKWAANIQNHLKQPIVNDNSLYYVLRKEIFCLELDTVDDLLGYYSNLLAAEGRRKTFLDILWPDFKENEQVRDITPDQRVEINQISKNIKDACKIKNNLTQKLEKEMANTITDKIMLFPSACWKKCFGQ